MSIFDGLLQLLVGFLFFILPYPTLIVGIFTYFFDPIHRLVVGISLVLTGGISLIFWFALLEIYTKTFGEYAAIILSDINSSKLPLIIGVLSICFGVLAITKRKDTAKRH